MYSWPAELSAMPPQPRAATRVIVVPAGIAPAAPATGTRDVAVVLLPSCPWTLEPQLYGWPSNEDDLRPGLSTYSGSNSRALICSCVCGWNSHRH